MMGKIVDPFVYRQRDLGMIREQDVSVYQYGYTLMLEGLLSVLLSLFIAMILREVKDFFAFLCFFLFHLESFVEDFMQRKHGSVLFYQIS